MIKLNEFFVKNYLCCGQTYDNYVFEGCSKELLKFANLNLKSTQNENCRCINICFTDEEEKLLEKIFNFCSFGYQKQILANSYFNAKFLLEILNQYNICYREFSKDVLQKQINEFLSGNYTKVVSTYRNMPTAFDVSELIKKTSHLELNVFCIDIQNKHIQMAVNDYISSRLPYSIKFFTNNNKLSTYYSSNGQFMQCPHDYISIDASKYILSVAENNK